MVSLNIFLVKLRGMHSNSLLKRHDGLVCFRWPQSYLPLVGLLSWIVADVKVAHFGHLGDGHLDGHVGVEADLDVVADWAGQGRFVLALDEVDYDRLVSLQVKVPVDLGDDLISVDEVREFNVFFTFNSIQVLVELVQHPVEEFLRIVLCVTLEH